ncbi:MAG: ABC transporter permease [Micromonosporaceae bacterium]|nr:ABC transporter permease [Micromonosporaceae bacterium]
MTQSPPPRPAPFVSTPNAERYLLEADSLRRRQLRSALLHGTSRTWRDRRRIWPAVVAGIVLVAVISAGIAIYGAFQQQQRKQQEEGSAASHEPPRQEQTLADWSS